MAHSQDSEVDIVAQIPMLKELRDDLDAAAGAVNRAEWIRRQLLGPTMPGSHRLPERHDVSPMSAG